MYLEGVALAALLPQSSGNGASAQSLARGLDNDGYT
jgi:hypothetical protein